MMQLIFWIDFPAIVSLLKLLPLVWATQISFHTKHIWKLINPLVYCYSNNILTGYQDFGIIVIETPSLSFIWRKQVFKTSIVKRENVFKATFTKFTIAKMKFAFTKVNTAHINIYNGQNRHNQFFISCFI